jgi:dTDP-4-dehydrorhamnose reductase
MRILVLGASGMLGNALFRLFSTRTDIEVFGTLRNDSSKLFFEESMRTNLIGGIDVNNFSQLEKTIYEIKPDIVINCIGVIKQHCDAQDPLIVIPINSLLPHTICRICSRVGARFIHLSTDCVFTGSKGDYIESDQPDARDLYGLTKFLGEVSAPHAITLRTSIIGHELQGHKSLIDWFLSQDVAVKGYKRAIFSGLPTVEIGEVILDYVLPNPGISGLYHLSSDPINKFDLLGLVASAYKKNIEIQEDNSLVIDRSLNSDRFRLATGYKPKSWHQLVSEMYKFL